MVCASRFPGGFLGLHHPTGFRWKWAYSSNRDPLKEIVYACDFRSKASVKRGTSVDGMQNPCPTLLPSDVLCFPYPSYGQLWKYDIVGARPGTAKGRLTHSLQVFIRQQLHLRLQGVYGVQGAPRDRLQVSIDALTRLQNQFQLLFTLRP